MRQRDTFHRYPYLLQFFYFVLISLGGLLISANIGTLAAVLIFGIDALHDTPAILLIQAISAVGSFLVPALWLSRMKKAFISDYLHLEKPIPFKSLILGIAAFLLISPSISVIQEWNMSWHFGPGSAALEDYFRTKAEQAEQISMQLILAKNWGIFLCSLAVIAIGAGICEEFFFRGALQNLLTEWLGNTHAAIWISALIFSMFHMDIFGLLPRCLLGALLGYLYVIFGTIWLPVLIHILNNALTATLYFLHYNGYVAFDPQIPNHGTVPLWAAVGLTGFILLCFFFRNEISFKHLNHSPQNQKK